MDGGEIIYREGPFTLVKYHSFSEDAVRLFDESLWGSEGALYEHKNTRDQLARIKKPLHVEVRKDNRLAGTCVFIERNVTIAGKNHTSYFIRYLIGKEEFRGKGIIKKYAAKTMELVREMVTGPSLFIGIVEHANKRSYKIVESVRFDPLSTIKTLSFSRFFPRDHSGVRIIRNDEKQEMATRLKEMYAEYAIWHTDNLYHGWKYYVLEEDGKIIAGVQASKGHWVVKQLPGLSGRIMMYILPRIPLVRKIFNPHDFNFAAFDYIYYRKGRVDALENLFNAVLKKLDVNSGLFWLDKRSPHLKEFRDKMRFGLLHRFTSGNDSYFMVGFENMDAQTIEKYKTMPAFQSSGDFI